MGDSSFVFRPSSFRAAGPAPDGLSRHAHGQVALPGGLGHTGSGGAAVALRVVVGVRRRAVWGYGEEVDRRLVAGAGDAVLLAWQRHHRLAGSGDHLAPFAV